MAERCEEGGKDGKEKWGRRKGKGMESKHLGWGIVLWFLGIYAPPACSVIFVKDNTNIIFVLFCCCYYLTNDCCFYTKLYYGRAYHFISTWVVFGFCAMYVITFVNCCAIVCSSLGEFCCYNASCCILPLQGGHS